MTMRISPTLFVSSSKESICCKACENSVAPYRSDVRWKDEVRLVSRPVAGTTGWADAVHPELIIREFVCPSCGHLLDSEVALSEDPFLYDVVLG